MWIGLFILWFIVGFISWGLIIYKEGELTVSDLYAILPVAILGPIVGLMYGYHNLGDEVLWRKK